MLFFFSVLSFSNNEVIAEDWFLLFCVFIRIYTLTAVLMAPQNSLILELNLSTSARQLMSIFLICRCWALLHRCQLLHTLQMAGPKVMFRGLFYQLKLQTQVMEMVKIQVLQVAGFHHLCVGFLPQSDLYGNLTLQSPAPSPCYSSNLLIYEYVFLTRISGYKLLRLFNVSEASS